MCRPIIAFAWSLTLARSWRIQPLCIPNARTTPLSALAGIPECPPKLADYRHDTFSYLGEIPARLLFDQGADIIKKMKAAVPDDEQRLNSSLAYADPLLSKLDSASHAMLFLDAITEAENIPRDPASRPGSGYNKDKDGDTEFREKTMSHELLTKQEEITLARLVQNLTRWKAELDELEGGLRDPELAAGISSLGPDVLVSHWADACGFGNIHDFVTALLEAKAAKERMILCNMRLVWSIAKKYNTANSMSMGDLAGEGVIGLSRACEKFDPERGFRFSTYATYWIRQAVQRAIASKSRLIRLPQGVVSGITILKNVGRELTDELGRLPSDEELLERINTPTIRMSKNMFGRVKEWSQDRTFSMESLPSYRPLRDVGPSPDEFVYLSCLKDSIDQILSELDPKEEEMIRVRFGIDGDKPLTIREIADIRGLSQGQVRSRIEKALRFLRKPRLLEKIREYRDYA